ncbi:MAG: M48 family metallopeptidase [Candidatus Omnitrophica bacterium]|nr:M48 family metallopeptidase [Candidatus Omnitrophota bacterium]
MEDKAKSYSSKKYLLALIECVWLFLLLALFQMSGLALYLEEFLTEVRLPFGASSPLLVFLYASIVFTLYLLVNFPLEIYSSFILEHRFGLSRQSFSSWLKEQIKTSIIGAVIFMILIGSFYYFLKRYPCNWWWISSIFWIFLSLILARLFPVLIIPLFFKYKRLESQDLRQRIFNLARNMGVKILDVYQIDFSKKTTKANAALVGFGKSKRVILTDTLEGKFSADEIEVILAHEFAHFRLKHILKLFILNAFLVLFVFYLLFKFSPKVFACFNLALTDMAGLGIWLFCFLILEFSLRPFLNWVSRNLERNADRVALKSTGDKSAFISMFEKLSEQNLSQRRVSWWVKLLFFDHPPVEERIAQARSS